MNKEKSSNNKPCFLYILLGIILIVFGFSAYKVLDYLIAQKQSEENVSFLSDIAITKIEEIPEKGKPAAGVRCIKLKDGDIVENVYIGDSKTEINFNDKETIPFSRVKISKRDGVGTKIRL